MPLSCQRLRLPSLSSIIRTPSMTTATEAPTTSTGKVSGCKGSTILKEEKRVVMMGAARVGKTCIVMQFLYDQFQNRHKETVEEMHRGDYDLPDGSTLSLDILDTSGSYEFPAMRSLYISNGDAFILVFAVDDLESWHEVERLRIQILEMRDLKVPMVVVANKADISDPLCCIDRVLIESIVRNEWKCGYVESSAKENTGIVAIFKELLVQANIEYNLSPAVRRRRQSLPAFSSPRGRRSPARNTNIQRHSCTIT